jgi:hypothetical protein
MSGSGSSVPAPRLISVHRSRSANVWKAPHLAAPDGHIDAMVRPSVFSAPAANTFREWLSAPRFRPSFEEAPFRRAQSPADSC